MYVFVFVFVCTFALKFAYETNDCINHASPFLFLQANHEEPHYEEVTNLQASAGEADGCVYVMANLPANQICYASVRFNKDSASTERGALPDDTNKNGASTCDYSTIMAHPSHPPGEEQTLYSTVSLTEETHAGDDDDAMM